MLSLYVNFKVSFFLSRRKEKMKKKKKKKKKHKEKEGAQRPKKEQTKRGTTPDKVCKKRAL